MLIGEAKVTAQHHLLSGGGIWCEAVYSLPLVMVIIDFLGSPSLKDE